MHIANENRITLFFHAYVISITSGNINMWILFHKYSGKT